jgi:rhodanese-related sulfurtransferase
MTTFSSLLDRIVRFFRRSRRHRGASTTFSSDETTTQLPKLGDDTRLRTLLSYFPHFRERLRARFGVDVDDREASRTLADFAARHRLPPPSVLYMALRLEQRFEKARGILPEDVARWRRERPSAVVIDCRERWELELPGIAGARVLDEALEALKREKSSVRAVLLYCHHGLRSADVAAHLADEGFEDVRWIIGGLDRYAATVDRSLPRYEAPPC